MTTVTLPSHPVQWYESNNCCICPRSALSTATTPLLLSLLLCHYHDLHQEHPIKYLVLSDMPSPKYSGFHLTSSTTYDINQCCAKEPINSTFWLITISNSSHMRGTTTKSITNISQTTLQTACHHQHQTLYPVTLLLLVASTRKL